MADDPEDYSQHFPKAYKEAQGMKRQLKFNNWLLGGQGLSNAREWIRPPGPDDAVHEKPDDDSEAAGSYSGGGSVRKFGSSTHVTCKTKG